MQHSSHSRESVLRIDGGNPGKHWIPPYQVRGRLNQARNDKIGWQVFFAYEVVSNFKRLI